MTQYWIISVQKKAGNLSNKSLDCSKREGKKGKSWHYHKPKKTQTLIHVHYGKLPFHWSTTAHEHLPLLPINSNLSRSLQKGLGKRRERNGISATSSAREDQRFPEGGRRKAYHSPQCSAAKWNNANQALIATSLARSSQLAAITLSVNSPTKGPAITN